MSAARQPDAARRVGDVVGISAVLVSTVALHLMMFGGDGHFALRFLLSPVGAPVAFAAFIGAAGMLVVALVRAAREHSWRQTLSGSSHAAERESAKAVDRFLDSANRRDSSRHATIAGAITRRALRTAVVYSIVNCLFMVVLVFAALIGYIAIFGISAALIFAVYVILRVREDRVGIGQARS